MTNATAQLISAGSVLSLANGLETLISITKLIIPVVAKRFGVYVRYL